MGIPINKIKTAGQKHFKNCKTDPNKTFFCHITPLRIIGFLAFFLYLLSACLIGVILTTLSVLPLKYLIILIAVSAFLAILFAFVTFKKIKKSKKLIKFFKILIIILEIFFTTIFIIAFLYLNHTINFMDSIRAVDYQIDNYSILVKKESKFNCLEDLHYGTIATYDDNSQSYNSALEQLAGKIKYKKVQEENLNAAIKSIATNQTDSLLIKNSLINLASEVFNDFNIDDYRNLYTITVETKITNIKNTDTNLASDSFNIYISGIDTFGSIATVSRSDVNMLVTANPKSHTILLTSIPRDYYVQLHNTSGLKDKLTHAGLYGVGMSINTIEDFLNTNIDYYIRINFDSAINLVDALGGIDITPDVSFTRVNKDYSCYFTGGTINHLDGLCALAYARERQVYNTGDLHRIQNQQDVLTAIIDKLTSSKTILTEYTKILSSLENSLETNIPSNQIYSLVNLQLDSMPSWTIERISLSGEHIDAPTYTISTENLFVFEPDPESITAATTKIKEVMAEN